MAAPRAGRRVVKRNPVPTHQAARSTSGGLVNPFTAQGTGTGKVLGRTYKPGQVAAGGGAAGQPDFAPGLPYNPAVAANIAGLGQQRDQTILGADGGQAAYLASVGAGADGSINYQDPLLDPRSRAYALQQKWQAAKKGALNTANHNLYAGAYQETVRSNVQGEATDKGALAGEVGQTLAGYGAQRFGAVGGFEQSVGGVLGNYGAQLAAAPDPTAPAKAGAAGPAPAAPVANGNAQAHGGAPKTVKKNGKVYHYYPDGTIMFVRNASA